MAGNTTAHTEMTKSTAMELFIGMTEVNIRGIGQTENNMGKVLIKTLLARLEEDYGIKAN